MTADLGNLKHIVIRTMKNRSFDHTLGALKKQYPKINGLAGNESNPDSSGAVVKVQPNAEFQGQLDPDPDQPLDISLIADEGKVALTRGGLGSNPWLHGFAAGLTLRAWGFLRSLCCMRGVATKVRIQLRACTQACRADLHGHPFT